MPKLVFQPLISELVNSSVGLLIVQIVVQHRTVMDGGMRKATGFKRESKVANDE